MANKHIKFIYYVCYQETSKIETSNKCPLHPLECIKLKTQQCQALTRTGGNWNSHRNDENLNNYSNCGKYFDTSFRS